jgi:hypothetical protein
MESVSNPHVASREKSRSPSLNTLHNDNDFEAACLKKEQEDIPAAVVPPEISLPLVDDYPDGGLKAWMVVFGVSVSQRWTTHEKNINCGSLRHSVLLFQREHLRTVLLLTPIKDH